MLSDAKGLSPMSDDFPLLARTVPVALTWAIILVALAAGIAITLRDATRRKRVRPRAADRR